MATVDLVSKLEELLEAPAVANGYELVAVEQTGGRHSPIIRVLVDREGGIDLEALTVANAWVSKLLDEVEPIPGPYTLEVSSPGIDRPLRKLADFARFAGETVTIKTRNRGGRATWTGQILRVDAENIVLDIDAEEVVISHSDISKARLKGVVDFSKGGNK